ncbi:MAG: ribosome biogenesis GTPase YlqF [Alkalibacterium sp.]|uniref:Ribosome biogenesis GTPase A n=1 Tax=Alkalibacterium gilvum TaxID=1130080 RepID=A0A1H6RFV3_9LACT|nr:MULTISPECIES: ribosome biogenesis GTPase YlqF [Alkalibacterium]MDN6293656.1 ribosome biogenesis GTPase YlqF [Alkalibacterium sp.]MDN6295285.1 ribosome biogenesis GTPase YlqF [Alkalibacterium sp.]MDN6385928.1 ribosome biogenesis GTPase YlqF [Alkalibacterium sp.]MDN6398582.1 ribosome biogenesis GTPase YlqF [Alkalibacterium sp.]SEI50062.1 ribosome biogenesis GTPase A [Alkalibacterium gilvum]
MIQWYPGHMAKAKRQFLEKLKMVDVVYELIDARIPYSSKNPDIVDMIGDKPHIVILMKSDLADPRQTKAWLKDYEDKGIPAISINAKKGQGLKEILKLTKEVLKPFFEKRKEKGMKPRAIRAVCVGIPNVGKSTLINRFARKNIAQTGNKPGVTKAQQWIKYGKELELLDTPGILWPKFEDQTVGKRLAVTGAIKDKLLHLDDIALYAMGYLKQNYKGAISERYKLKEGIEQEYELPELLIEITKVRGFRDDYERGAEMFIHELRNGQLGRISLERPDEIYNEETDNQ